MDYVDNDIAHKKLENIIYKKGYKMYCQPFKSTYVNQTKKTVVTHAFITEEENIRISHEIGHIYLWTIEKYFRYLTEILAWILGFIICKHNKINTQGYWKIVKECLDTYKVSYFKNK